MTFFLLPLTPIANAQVPPVSWVYIRQVGFGKSCSIPLRDRWKGVEAFIICWFKKKKKKRGKEQRKFLITLKFCKYDVSFSLARTFIFPQAASRLARLLSQTKCAVKWSKVVFVHFLCFWLPFAMPSKCCLNKGFAQELAYLENVSVYVFTGWFKSNMWVMYCILRWQVCTLYGAHLQPASTPAIAPFCLKLFNSVSASRQQGYWILYFPAHVRCC